MGGEEEGVVTNYRGNKKPCQSSFQCGKELDSLRGSTNDEIALYILSVTTMSPWWREWCWSLALAAAAGSACAPSGYQAPKLISVEPPESHVKGTGLRAALSFLGAESCWCLH